MRVHGLTLALASVLAASPVMAQDTSSPAPATTEQAATPAAAETPTGGSVQDTAASTTPAAATPAPTTPATAPPSTPVDVQPAALDETTGATVTPPVQDTDMGTTTTPASTDLVPPATPAPAGDTRTDAERDFDALYANGGQRYNPVADPTLPPPAVVPTTYDPWERYNRQMHRFNNAIDRAVARPLARAYVRAVPRPVRLGVSNFFTNLGQPVSAVNALLQGKPKQAAHSLGRFVLNSTLGIGGVFDPASDAKLQLRSEDFGQTLGTWGWKRSRYVELPLFGPRTVRDVFGMVADAPLSPVRQIQADDTRLPLQFLQLVDVRAQLLTTDSLREGAEDDYALVRDAWSQRRDYQIFGDRHTEGEDALPDYLQEENNPTVPVDAMPVMPTDGGGGG